MTIRREDYPSGVDTVAISPHAADATAFARVASEFSGASFNS